MVGFGVIADNLINLGEVCVLQAAKVEKGRKKRIAQVFAAATLIGTNQTFIGAGFYHDMTDVDGMATVLIHELMHQQGAGAEIDNYVDNYEQIATACGTRNSAR